MPCRLSRAATALEGLWSMVVAAAQASIATGKVAAIDSYLQKGYR